MAMKKIFKTVPIFFYLCVFCSFATQAQASDWCVRRQSSASACEIMRDSAGTVTVNVSAGIQVLIHPEGESDQIEVIKDSEIIASIRSGFVDAPVESAPVKLEEPKVIEGILALRPDGIFEIGKGAGTVFYVPLTYGLILVPHQKGLTSLWLRGAADPVSFVRIQADYQEKTAKLSEYLNLPKPSADDLSNLYLEEEYLSLRSEAPQASCCCGGTGKKTLALMVPGVPGNSQYLKDIVAALPENQTECVEFKYMDYGLGSCLDELKRQLQRMYAMEFNGGQNNWCGIKVPAHSLGGVIAAKAASSMAGDLLNGKPGADIHSIASPLDGVGQASGIIGALWDSTYILPVGWIVDAAMDCALREGGAGGHSFPPLGATTSFTPHTSEPTATFPTATQIAAPHGSNPPVHHPGTDHDSVVPAALDVILDGLSCCKNGRVDDGVGEDCDPPGTGCTEPTTGKNGICTDTCKCKSYTCGNGVIEPGEVCDGSPVGCPNPGSMACASDCNCIPIPTPSPTPTQPPPTCNGKVVPGPIQCTVPGSQCLGMTPSGSGTCTDECKCVDNCDGADCQQQQSHSGQNPANAQRALEI